MQWQLLMFEYIAEEIYEEIYVDDIFMLYPWQIWDNTNTAVMRTVLAEAGSDIADFSSMS